MTEKSPAAKACRYEGCDRKYYGKGVCNLHYQRERRPKFEKVDRRCSFEGCGSKHYAKGYCARHWQRLKVGRLLDSELNRRPNGIAAARDHEGRKQCVGCQLWLSVDNYSAHRATADRLQVRCRACVYVARHFTQYRLRPEDIAQIMREQDHQCAVCSADISGRYVVDHNHACCPGVKSCGKCVRGFLCDGCNLGLGAFKDSKQALLRAIEYLQLHDQVETLPNQVETST